MSDTNDSFAPTRDSASDASPPATGHDTATFATWNVLHGRLKPKGKVDLDAFGEAVASLKADVVGLQEVDFRQLRSGRADMTAVAAAAAGGYGRFGPVRRRYDMGLYGNAIVSASPTADESVVSLPRLRWRNERRGALAVSAPAAGVHWSVATTHLSLHRDESAAQLAYLLDVMNGRPGPRVVLGDFNREPHEVEDLAAARGWQVVTTGATYPSWGPVERIDFVLVQGADIVGSEVRSLEVSDHCAVLSELRPRP